MTHIIYLAYADHEKDSLPSLNKEADTTYRILFHGGPNHLLEPFKNSRATTEKIVQDLVELRNQIAIFHYSGHASNDRLLLEDVAGDPLGLAVLLGKCPNLRLIFLNGCSTKAQVDCMLETSFPRAVIATEEPVSDEIAAEFAIRFYEQLRFKGTTIREAFDVAKGIIQFRHELSTEFRGIGLDSQQNRPNFSWDLYASSPEADKWTIDFAISAGRRHPLNMEEYLMKLACAFEPIVTILLDSHQNNTTHVVEPVRDIIAEWEQFKSYIEQIKEAKSYNHGRLIERISNILPTPVGMNLKFFLREIKRRPKFYEFKHLQLTLNIFDACMELLAFSMISQVWEAINHTGRHVSDYKEIRKLRRFFLSSNREARAINLIDVIRSARRLLEHIIDDEAKEKLVEERFISELYELKKEYEEDSPLQRSIVFFNTLKRRLVKQQILQQQVDELFTDAVYHLSTFIARLNFIIRYSLVTVKSIHVLKYRHYPHPAFDHKMAPLLIQNTFTYEPYQFDDFALTQTVVLLKDLNRMGSNLPLSPFIFDKNVFFERSNESDLLVYNGYQQETDTFVFRRVTAPEEVEVIAANGEYALIKEQLDAFSVAVFGQSFNQLS